MDLITKADLLPPLSPNRHREPRTITELSALCGLSSTQVLLRAEDGAGATRLSEETLVRVTRHFLQTGQQREAERVFDVLVQRTASWIRKYTGPLRQDTENAANDVVHDIYCVLYEGVCDQGPSGEFWECRFWVCLPRRALPVVQKFYDKKKTELSIIGRNDAADEAYIIDTNPKLVAADLVRSSMEDDAGQRDALVDALARLPNTPRPLLRAFILRYGERLQIASLNQTERTVASVLGVSRSTVENYLDEAETILEVHRREN